MKEKLKICVISNTREELYTKPLHETAALTWKLEKRRKENS
jgi:hypothetical protein